MTVLKSSEVPRFIDNPPGDIVVLLVYGPNHGRVSDIVSRVTISVIGSLDDPFNLVSLSESQLKDAPGLLRDEFLSLSFTGGRKVIQIEDPGTVIARALPEAVAGTETDNLLIIRAGNLKKTSSLRKYCEKSTFAACIPCYDDTQQELAGIIVSTLQSAGKNIDKAAINILLGSVGSNRLLLSEELQKLISYTGSANEVTISDIEVLSANSAESSLDEISDLTLSGSTSRAVERFSGIIASGVLPSQVLSTLNKNLIQIQKFRLAIEDGHSVDSILKTSRPPVFFKRQPIIKRQLGMWHSSTIKTALAIVYNATMLTRKNTDLAPAICERALVSISKTAKNT